MRRLLATAVFVIVLAVMTSACAAPTPTATPPRPTDTLTPAPSPTSSPTVRPTVPPTSTSVPTSTTTPTQAPPTATSLPPTRTPPPATLISAIATAAPKPPAPGGSIVFHTNKDGLDRLFHVDPNTHTITPLVDVGPSLDFSLDTNAHIGEFSPDNTRFAWIFARGPNSINVLNVLHLADGRVTSAFSGETGGGLSSPTWSPDGKRIAFIRLNSNRQLWAVSVMNADGTGTQTDLKLNTAGEQFRGGVSWSKLNALTFAMNTTGHSDIYTLFTDGFGLKNLTNHPADDSTPVWSPDGKRIAFTSDRDGVFQIYVMNADGTGLRRVSKISAPEFSPTWSPDGNWLAFTSIRYNAPGVYMMDLNGDNEKRIIDGDHPIWSR